MPGEEASVVGITIIILMALENWLWKKWALPTFSFGHISGTMWPFSTSKPKRSVLGSSQSPYLLPPPEPQSVVKQNDFIKFNCVWDLDWDRASMGGAGNGRGELLDQAVISKCWNVQETILNLRLESKIFEKLFLLLKKEGTHLYTQNCYSWICTVRGCSQTLALSSKDWVLSTALFNFIQFILINYRNCQ